MQVEAKKTTKRAGIFLYGLRSIRLALGLEAKELAAIVDLHPTHLGRLEHLHQGCTGGTRDMLCKALGCTASDIESLPTDQRLKEIRATYLEREAAKARAAATPAGGAA